MIINITVVHICIKYKKYSFIFYGEHTEKSILYKHIRYQCKRMKSDFVDGRCVLSSYHNSLFSTLQRGPTSF